MANIKNFGIVGLGSNVQFGKGGAKLVQNQGTFAARSADNSAFVRFAIANAVQNDDAVTLRQLNAAVAAASGDSKAVQDELDKTQAGAGLAADGSYVAPASGVLANATSLKDADDKLAALIARLATTTEENAVAQQYAIDDLLSNTVAQQTKIDAAKAKNDAQDGRLDTAENDIKKINGDVSGLGTRLTTAQGDIDALEGDLANTNAAHAALLANAIVKDGSVAMTGALNLGHNVINNVADPVAATDAANKQWVESKVSNLGNAFEYKGVIANAGENEASALDLETIAVADRAVGDYYKVTKAGWVKLGAAGVAAYFNVNDGLVFSGAGFDKIDNTDSVSKGTAGEIVVEGSVDTGFAISIDGAYTAARRLEVSNEANARAAADAVLTNAVTDVATGLAQELRDRANAVSAVQDAVEAVESDLANAVEAYEAADEALASDISNVVTSVTALANSTTANAAAQQAAIDALKASVSDVSRLNALESNAAAQQADIDGLEANAAAQQHKIEIVANDLAKYRSEQSLSDEQTSNRISDLEDEVESNAIAQQAAINALAGNAVAQQAEIDALENALENLSQDTIISINEKYAVHAGNTAVEVTNLDATTKLEMTLDNDEARIAVVSSGAGANADLRLVAQGAGQVIIGDEGEGIIQADDGYDMTVAGGASSEGGPAGKLFLKGAEVSIQDEDGTKVAKFVSGGSALANVSTTNDAVTFAAEGVDTDVDLVFSPKGAGHVDVSDSRVVNVADGVAATDAVNKGQLDAAVAEAQVGHVVSLSASVAATDGQVSLGAVTGMVTRVRVVVLTAYNTGATITVGTEASASDLVDAADLDESAAGVYIIETANEYNAANLVVTIAGASAGSAKVYVEYIKG